MIRRTVKAKRACPLLSRSWRCVPIFARAGVVADIAVSFTQTMHDSTLLSRSVAIYYVYKLALVTWLIRAKAKSFSVSGYAAFEAHATIEYQFNVPPPASFPFSRAKSAWEMYNGSTIGIGLNNLGAYRRERQRRRCESLPHSRICSMHGPAVQARVRSVWYQRWDICTRAISRWFARHVGRAIFWRSVSL